MVSSEEVGTQHDCSTDRINIAAYPAEDTNDVKFSRASTGQRLGGGALRPWVAKVILGSKNRLDRRVGRHLETARSLPQPLQPGPVPGAEPVDRRRQDIGVHDLLR